MSNCQQTQVNLKPLNDSVGLYINGKNTPPESYLEQGIAAAEDIGKVDGKKVISFIGMSNWNQEIKAFLRLYRERYTHRQNTWFNAGRGGWDLARIAETQANDYWTWYHNKLTKANIKPNQVQVLFHKNSLAGRNGKHLPVNLHITEYKRLLRLLLDRSIKELPNLKQIYLSSAIYSGYAIVGSPRIEPNAYYEGVAVKDLITEYMAKPMGDYWLAWGPYLWGDGVNLRKDGLQWLCDDVEDKDGVHPDTSGEIKVAKLLLDFMEDSPTTTWFWQ